MRHIHKSEIYTRDYIHAALLGAELAPPDDQDNPLHEVLFTLYQAYRQNGTQGAVCAWQEILRQEPSLRDLDPTTNPLIPLLADHLDLLPPINWLLEDRIQGDGLNVLYGPSGSGKSFVALDMALQVARREHTVIYVAAEGEAGYADRKNALCEYHGYSAENVRFIPRSISLMDHEQVETLVTMLEAYNPDLVVIDTLARCMIGGDENSSKDMGILIEGCNILQRRLDTAVLLIHHSGKKGATERGSSALRGAAEVMLELRNDDGLLSLICNKSKNATTFDPEYMELQEVTLSNGSTSCVVVPTTRRTQTQHLTPQRRLVLEMLNEPIYLESGARWTRIKAHTGITADSSLSKTLSILKQAGYITQSKDGEPYKISEDGKRALNS